MTKTQKSLQEMKVKHIPEKDEKIARDEYVDSMCEDSFPASDPPSSGVTGVGSTNHEKEDVDSDVNRRKNFRN